MDVHAGRRSRSPTSASTTSSARSGRSPRTRAWSFAVELAPDLPTTILTDEQRLQQVLQATCSPTRSSSPSRAGRLVIGRGPDASSGPERCARSRRGRLRGHRHRHRHPVGQAEADLRGVPAGRRHDLPQVRRDRARAVDQPGDRAPARRRDRREQRVRHGLDVRAAPADDLPPGRGRCDRAAAAAARGSARGIRARAGRARRQRAGRPRQPAAGRPRHARDRTRRVEGRSRGRPRAPGRRAGARGSARAERPRARPRVRPARDRDRAAGRKARSSSTS